MPNGTLAQWSLTNNAQGNSGPKVFNKPYQREHWPSGLPQTMPKGILVKGLEQTTTKGTLAQKSFLTQCFMLKTISLYFSKTMHLTYAFFIKQ